MVTISLSFTAGRFSATPWGHHVNEGAVEWPPSSWRLLRGLAAVWKNTAPEIQDREFMALATKLAELPRYALPPAGTTHTRHYMPDGDSKSLIFDTCVTVDRRTPLLWQWPEVILADDEERLLGLLLSRLPYLGRAESWAAGAIGAEGHRSVGSNCRPLGAGDPVEFNEEAVAILVPDTPLQLEHLLASTGDLRKKKLDPTTPPGAHWQRYARLRNSFVTPMAPPRVSVSGPVTVARYTLAGPVLPTVLDTVSVAEATRRAVMGLYGRSQGNDVSPMLSGKAADGTPLADHLHAHYLPTDENEDGHLDHITIVARAGFSVEDQHALGSLNRLRLDHEVEVHTPLIYLGDTPVPDNPWLLRRAPVWISLTPFVMARHPKRYKNGKPRLNPNGTQVDGPEDQLRRELARRNLPQPVRITSLPRCTIGKPRSWQEFQRWRQHGAGSPAWTMGFGYALEFAEPISGPLALGYGAHFGLGAFVPATTSRHTAM